MAAFCEPLPGLFFEEVHSHTHTPKATEQSLQTIKSLSPKFYGMILWQNHLKVEFRHEPILNTLIIWQ